MTFFSKLLAALGVLAFSAVTLFAQAAYPDKAIRVIIPFPPGGGTDITSRQFANWLERDLRQNLVIDNRPGAGGTLGIEIASQASPDGYTVLITSASFATAPAMYRTLRYDPMKDFEPIYLLARQPHMLVVPPSLPVKSFKELDAHVKANPGKLNYASAGNGSSIHLSTELLLDAARWNIVHVPYRGSGPAIIDTAGARAHLLFGTMPSLVPQVRSGRLKAIAVSAEKRAPAVPDVPTIMESGLPGFTYYAWYGMLAPEGTPKAAIRKLHGILQQVSSDKEVQAKLIDQGLEPWIGTPEQFDQFIAAEIARWKKVVRQAGIPQLN